MAAEQTARVLDAQHRRAVVAPISQAMDRARQFFTTLQKLFIVRFDRDFEGRNEEKYHLGTGTSTE